MGLILFFRGISTKKFISASMEFKFIFFKDVVQHISNYVMGYNR